MADEKVTLTKDFWQDKTGWQLAVPSDRRSLAFQAEVGKAYVDPSGWGFTLWFGWGADLFPQGWKLRRRLPRAYVVGYYGIQQTDGSWRISNPVNQSQMLFRLLPPDHRDAILKPERTV